MTLKPRLWAACGLPAPREQQEIRCVACSSDCQILAVACHSGQVYIFHCDKGQLKPLALSLAGWLGPDEVHALSFCKAPAGLKATAGCEDLLVVLANRLRLLDVKDGRCVATLPSEAESRLMVVLEDGRHAVLSGEQLWLIDLWSSRSRVLGGPCERLAAPGQKRSQLRLAAQDHEVLRLWLADSSTNSKALATPSYTYNFSSRGPVQSVAVALAFEDDLVVLVLRDRLLFWNLGESELGPVQISRAHGEPLSNLAGGTLLRSATSSSNRKLRDASRTRSCPELSQMSGEGSEPTEPTEPTLLLWSDDLVLHCLLRTEQVVVLGDLPMAIESMNAWQHADGSFYAVASQGGALHMCVQSDLCKWKRCVQVGALWPSVVAQGTLTLSAVVPGSTGPLWLMSFADSEVLALPLILDSGKAEMPEEVRRLQLQEGFGMARCALGLSSMIAVGGSSGMLSWWSTSDWKLLGSSVPAYAAEILHLARVWIRPSNDEALVPEASMLAALDDMGKCRLVDLSKGEALCTFQAQTHDVSLWIDQPLRFIYDPVGGWISAMNPEKVWTWDVTSGAFSHSRAFSGSKEDSWRKFSGLDSVCWQAAESSTSMWQLGEVMMDGPLWKVPVLLAAPQELLRRDAAQRDTGGTVSQCFWRLLPSQLRKLGVHFADSPVGVLGVDDSLSFPLGGSSEFTPSMSSAMRMMMEEPEKSLAHEAPEVFLAVLARALLSPELTRQVLQRWWLPQLSRFLSEGPFLVVTATIKAFTQLLQGEEVLNGFVSPQAGADAATLLLALIAQHRQSRYSLQVYEQSLVEGLLARMVGKTGSGQQVQVMACEVLALTFPVWQKHLQTAVPKRGTSSAGKPQDSDEVLERLALQALALYQEPHMAGATSALLLQVGHADATALLQVMSKAAVRVDISPAYASSAVLLLQLFVQKAPEKVCPLLPRLAEALLRCLEPSDPTLRRHSLLAVTSALHEVVQTFPMVDFHQDSQKFAVGTGDGVIVVYDLRTATKWRVFEGHNGAVAGLAFTQDAARLASYSSLDCTVRLWQTGGGFFGLGQSSRCIRQQMLPPLQGVGNWRAVSLRCSERGVKLVRENGDMLHLGMT